VRELEHAFRFTEMSEKSVERQPDAERSYKHLAELAAPVSTCKLLINQ
jgi:hypothetical protein